MARTRVLAALAAAVALAAVVAMPASAVVRPVFDHTVTTAHFMVHYETDLDASGHPAKDYSTQSDASDVASYAEAAYALYTSWGYPAPVDDGDHLIDIYLDDLTADPGVVGFAEPDSAAPGPSSGLIVLATPTQMQAFATTEGLTTQQEEQKTTAHELFHLFQFATWEPANLSDDWLLEGSAQWAGFTAIGEPSGSVVTTLGPENLSLDCRDSLPGHQMCDADPYNDGGYSRWAFFQTLATKYGNAFLTSVLANGATGQTAITALSNAIIAKGGTLAGVFTDYATALMDGGFGIPALSSIRPTPYANVPGGTVSGKLATVSVSVDHLGVRYVTFERGDGDGSHACYAATLTINVAMPSGVSSQPYFYWDSGGTPTPLTVNGSTATATVPWDTCDWGATRGWLSLPNASTNIDGAAFTVTGSIAVDTTTPASASSAPTQVPVWGTTVPVPSADVAPLIEVYGPELLQLSATAPAIRLIVESSGPGTVNAALGATVLGTRTLRAGNNDLRFVVPASLLKGLRRSASAANLLTLTPMSPSGVVSGTVVTRKVSIPAPVKTTRPKPKPKKKTKK